MADVQGDEDKKRRAEVALAFFNHVEGQVGLATNKTALLIAANAFLIAAYLTLLKDFKENVPATAIKAWYASIGIAFLLLAVALCCSLWAVYPTRRPRPVNPEEELANGTDSAQMPPIKENLLFFGHVAANGKDWRKYLREFQEAKADDLLRHVLTQAHAKSYYLARMFFWVQWGMALTMFSLLAFAVAVTMAIIPTLVG